MITKPTIIITSLGRTGTQFFAQLFSEVIPQCTAVHEPDIMNVVEYKGVERYQKLWEKVNEVGAINILMRKPLGQWGLVHQSDARFLNQVSDAQAIMQMLKQRQSFIHSRPGNVYAESSLAFYGLLDLLPQAFKDHQAAYIIRNGRTWVQSWMNWGKQHGGIYGKSRLGRIMGHNWPTADDLPSNLYYGQWSTMTRFERLCWGWANLNSYALSTLNHNPNAKCYRFEDLFSSETNAQNLANMVQSLTGFKTPISTLPLQGWVEKQTHQSKKAFPAWSAWNDTEKKCFEKHCGSLMAELGYDQ